MSDPLLNETSVNCIRSEHSVYCDGDRYDLPEKPLSVEDSEFWVYLIGYICLVLFADNLGMMSGLTLSIFSLDMTSLKVLQMAGSGADVKYAARIRPLASRQYLVLVSLVLANSLAVEAMPILLDKISTPYIAIGVSVSAVLIFGEVLPQAICGRYGLVMGYYFSWLVWTLIAVLFIVGWPLSKVLECLLGKNAGTFYRRSELKALVDIHGPQKKHAKGQKPKKRTSLLNLSQFKDTKQKELSPAAVEEAQRLAAERLTIDEVLIIKGALELATKQAKHAVIPLASVYMVSLTENINGEKLQQILDAGHSRIPIYSSNRENIHGILLTKRLITADPSKSVPVKDFLQDARYFYPPYYVDSDTPLYMLLNTFQEGTSTHIAFVTEKQQDSSVKVIGVLTLEDIIEELIMEDIEDEKDVINKQFKQFATASALRKLTQNHSKKSTRSKKSKK